MTAPMMASMPTPDVPALAANGYHHTSARPAGQPFVTPAHPAAPASRTTAQQAQLDQRRALARAERTKLIETKGRFVKWLLRAIYLLAVVVAGVGQSTGLVAKMALPMFVAAMFVVAVEGFAVGFAAVADYRRRLGENAYLSYTLAAAFSGFAVVVNWWGHHDINPFLAGVYAVFSAAGFVTFVIESAFNRRDSLWKQNKIDDPPPLYGLWLTLTQPRLIARAKLHAIADPGLGRSGSLEAARLSLAADARRAAMKRLIDTDLRRVYGPEGAELLASVIDPDQLANEISAQAELGKLGEIYARRIDPQQIEEAHAVERAERRRGSRFGRRKVTVTATAPVPPSADGAPSQVTTVRTVQRAGRPAGKGQLEAPSKRSTEQWAAMFRELVASFPARSLDDSSWLAGETGLTTSRVRAIKRWMREQEEMGGA